MENTNGRGNLGELGIGGMINFLLKWPWRCRVRRCGLQCVGPENCRVQWVDLVNNKEEEEYSHDDVGGDDKKGTNGRNYKKEDKD
jgi:hypothetical protein